MVQTTEHGRGDDRATVGRLRLSAKRRVALQALMRTTTVVVSEELLEHTAQAILTEDNHVVQVTSINFLYHPL